MRKEIVAMSVVCFAEKYVRLNFEQCAQNMVEYAPVEKSERTGAEMNAREDLVLTGWGYPEYVAAAAAALKALKGDADVCGVSRRRLPELIEELADAREGRDAAGRRVKRIYILGVSVLGDTARLAAALRRLKSRGVKTMWISALEMPGEAAPALAGVMEAKVYDTSLLEAVGQALAVDVEEFMPFLKDEKRAAADIRAYISFVQAAQFYYRNYGDRALRPLRRTRAHRKEPRDGDAAGPHQPGGGARTRPRPHPRRKRHRQGNRRPADTHEEPEMQDAVRCLQLRERDERAP